MDKSISLIPIVFWQRRWPAIVTFASVLCAAGVYLLVTPPQYEATARLIVQDSQPSVSELGRDITTVDSPTSVDPMATQVELARSHQVLERALTQFSSQGRDTLPEIETLEGNLQVSIVPATPILEMSYRDSNPVLAAELLNSVAKAVVTENHVVLRSQALSVGELLKTEVARKRAQLAQSEAALSRYQQANGIVSLDDQTERWVNESNNLEAQERALMAQLQETNARDNSLRRRTNLGSLKDTYGAVRAGQNEELKRLRAKLGELDSQIAANRTRLRDNHPELVALIEERNNTRALYNQKLARQSPGNNSTSSLGNEASDEISQTLASKLVLSESERSALASKLSAVRAERVNYQNRLEQVPVKARNLAELRRQSEEAASSLKLLQAKLEEARIAEAQSLSNVSIIDRAEAPTTVKWPSPSVVLLVATAAGVVLAVCSVLILEMLDSTLRNATEVAELVKLPVLGVLPVLPPASLSLKQPELFLNDLSLVEPYRTLFRSMEFCSLQDLKLVVVSSTVSQEGKSVVVSHLAAVMAILSRRTLIIDADLRRPTQHKLFNLVAQPGLTDVISGDISLAEAVQETSIEHLSVLTCGQIHSQPSQFLESARMQTLLAEASAYYDLVIVDTAPVTSCVDAITLSHNSNGKLLLVARPNFTQKDILRQATSELTSSHVDVMGVTVNGITTLTEKYYRYPALSYRLLPWSSS